MIKVDHSQNKKSSGKIILAGFILLILDIIATTRLTSNTNGKYWAIVSLIFIVSIILIIFGFLKFIVSKLKSIKMNARKISPSHQTSINQLLKEQFLKPEIPSPNDYTPTTKPQVLFTISSSASELLVTNIFMCFWGILLIYIFSKVRGSFSWLFFIIGSAVVVSYGVVDFIIWKKRGIRKIELTTSGIIMYKGQKLEPFYIENDQITAIDIFTKVNRKIVNILLTSGKFIHPLPGLTFFSGPRVRITNDAFKAKEFENFIQIIRELYKPLITAK